MKNFKKGDIVIALTNPLNKYCQSRIKGKSYTVNDVMYCCNCGIQAINIGVKSYHILVSCKCGSSQSNKGLQWTNSIHFIKVDDLEFGIESALKEEDYELAIILRDFKIDLIEN